MNKVLLTGRLGQDPEVRYTPSGKTVSTFPLAVNRWAAPGANPEVDWVSIVAWEKLAETCGNNLAKGRRILVDGRLQVRSYEANDGSKRRVTEVVAINIEFLDYKQASGTTVNDEPHDIGYFGRDVFPDDEAPF